MLHSWINSVDDQGRLLFEGPLDSPLDGAERFTVYRVRFQIANQGDLETVITPALEVQGVNGWQSMPLVDPERGTPFYGASDDGRVFRPRTQKIAADALRLTDEGATAIAGRSSAGIALSEVVLPAHTYTEVEFAVRATIDAEWGERYVFRLTDGAEVVPGEHSAMLLMNPKPGIELSPGQRQGRGIKDPVPLYRLDPSVALTDLPSGGTPLAASIASVTFNLRGPIAAPAVPTTPHLVEGLTSDTCAACHAAHDAQGMMLQQQPDPQSGTCFTCHDGTGALSDVRSDWANPSLPANDPDTSSYYSHPATSATSGHVSGTEDEFAGVLNRHAVCADCHQPHLADSGRTAQSTSGWTASGAIQAPGVGVTNGAAGEAPAYEWKQIATLEYELCLKCHSGYTELPEQDPAHPSRWALDKAIELNPANTSYHPVEAAGTNQTSAMAASLAGTSPYKLWAFETDEMVRCVNCHGDSDNLTPANPPAANARSDNHASENRGILLAPYRDRDLKSVADQYGAEDFALCYLCHAEAPMVDDSADRRTDTNFSWHGYHMFDIAGNGTGGTDIDTPGAGAGNAVCAECHFRTHGTALATGIQAQAPRLVNFAPNVRPVGGILRFSPAGSGTLGSCTLNCHGKTHVNYLYDGAVEP